MDMSSSYQPPDFSLVLRVSHLCHEVVKNERNKYMSLGQEMSRSAVDQDF